MTRTRRSVGILLFDGVEVLDFAGPYEVFSRTRLVPGPESRRSEDSAPFEVLTLAARERVTATGGLVVVADRLLDQAPPLDILVVPGGFGTRALLGDEPTLAWLRERAGAAELVTSVCTGSLLLGAAGLLDGRRATTHHAALDALDSFSRVTVDRDSRVVVDGVITSAGVSAGIDMAFDVVERLHGSRVADETAAYIEYQRSTELASSRGA